MLQRHGWAQRGKAGLPPDAPAQNGPTQTDPAANDPNKTGIPGPASVPPQAATLRQTASSRNLLVGTAVAIVPLRTDPLYAALLRQQANILVAENAMKFGLIHPERHRYFFDDADFLMQFAQTNGMQLRGHNFVWHRQLPAWFDAEATPQNAASLLVEHIEIVGGRYAGRIQSWDVVNEAIDIQSKLQGSFRDTPWYRLLGPRYLDLAFQTARRVDPKALLCYNEYGIEEESPEAATKRTAVLDLLRGMQQRDVPLDAVGIQSHLTAGPGHNYGAGLQQFLRELRAMGLRVMLTEMDVNDRELPPALPQRDRAVADVYAQYLSLTLADPNVIALLTWGLSDGGTWLNHEQGRTDQQPARPLPFDSEFRPKEAYVAELTALRNAPPRA